MSKELKNINLEDDALPSERALGLHWDVESDKFTFQIIVKNKPPTRRGILSIVSSVYDPLGFISPYVLTAKIILQKLCNDKIGWDEEICGENLIFWNKWLNDLPCLEEFAVERCLLPSEFGNVVRSQLHHFPDASEIGYGTVCTTC